MKLLNLKSDFFYYAFYLLKSKWGKIENIIRIAWLRLQGASIRYDSIIQKINCSFPNKISIGAKCIIEKYVYFKYDGFFSKGVAITIGKQTFIGSSCEFNIKGNITIGNYCLIASGCRFVDHDHGINKSTFMCYQPCENGAIGISDDVWIGANAVILKNVTIGKGAVIAAGSVVNKSVPEYEIWAGVPAKKIGERN